MTIVTSGEDHVIEQITKQLNKQIDVIKVVDLNDKDFVDREMALIKIHAPDEHRAEALRIVDIFRAKVIDSSPKHYSIEVTGSRGKVDAIINLLRPIGIKEIVRTGSVALQRN